MSGGARLLNWNKDTDTYKLKGYEHDFHVLGFIKGIKIFCILKVLPKSNSLHIHVYHQLTDRKYDSITWKQIEIFIEKKNENDCIFKKINTTK
jgi:hypothetical protein